MSFKSGVGNAAGPVFGEALWELPWTLLSDCPSIEGFVFIVVFSLSFCAVVVILLGLATAVSEAFARSGF